MQRSEQTQGLLLCLLLAAEFFTPCPVATTDSVGLSPTHMSLVRYSISGSKAEQLHLPGINHLQSRTLNRIDRATEQKELLGMQMKSLCFFIRSKAKHPQPLSLRLPKYLAGSYWLSIYEPNIHKTNTNWNIITNFSLRLSEKDKQHTSVTWKSASGSSVTNSHVSHLLAALSVP